MGVHNFNFLFLAGISFVICTYFLELVLSKESQYEICKPKSCKTGPNISYPFYFIDNKMDYCGRPGLGIKCEGGRPTYRTSGASYIIENIDYEKHSFLLVSVELGDPTCSKPLQNFAFDRSSLEFATNHADLAFFYNCNEPLTVNYPTSLVTCDPQATNKTFVALVAADENVIWKKSSCESVVSAPIQLENGGINMTIADIDYQKLLKDGFMLKWVELEYDCEACQRSGGRCGFLRGRSICYCPDGPHQNNCNKGNPRLDLKIGLGASVAGFGALVIAGFFLTRKYSLISSFCSKGRGGKHDVEEFLKSYGTLAPKRFSYSEIKKITKSFREKLGKGGYGEVFKGKLPDGSLVAVKVLTKSKTNGEDFINEVASIGRTSHVNIVTLLGFCFEGSKQALIYEFMSGGSLEKYIYEESYSNDDRQLGWETLLDIAIGIARGLEYLHRGCNTRILHFDIKPHNILLDENLCPKVSDFGLAKICPQRESIISMVGARGTAGYIAPEVFCRNFGGVSHKSDVYSYGMMVFEMVGGRKNIRVEVEKSSEIHFPHWIHKRLELGEDLGLCGTRNVEERQIAKKMILVSLWCIQTSPSDRPAMDRVVEMLQGSLESIPIPPKPYLSSPSGSPQISMSSSPSTSILTGQISEQVIKEVMG